jgi:predicted alpha/beta-fold hydrolase
VRPFQPLISSPHLLTILGHYWPRNLDTRPYPIESHLYQTDADTQVLVQTQKPLGAARGAIVMVHGLEGSGEAGYMRTMAHTALHAGYIAHRFHMRTCGGTEHLTKTVYHGGLTGDLLAVLRQWESAGQTPVHLVGYSLGGNVVAKLAGELGEKAAALITSVCAVSTPIDLNAGARRLAEPSNRLYEQRFLRRMRARVLATKLFSEESLNPRGSLWDFDDRITGPSFGFRGAEHYYQTQSCQNFLEAIRVPTLFVQAKDDIFIPFEMFDHQAFRTNPWLKLIVTERGGHLGFLSRRKPRFWVDEVVMEWIAGHTPAAPAVPAGQRTLTT